ncbi:polygalacturonase-like [Impatiens glandulifera]|uniref:polygalacturonase-like n=1 Tax=Impatiens glandulifera TaxID=253017 RepID=UPI001FB180B1|nr:polygalacturonase-like [Impatiens glandulifera]
MSSCLVFTLILNSLIAAATAATYNVVTFGAKANGKTDSTKAFLSTWASACASSGKATIYVPSGRYLIGSTAVFSGLNCKFSAITIRIDGTLVAPSDYRILGSSVNWIMFQRVNGISINGGILDGQGTSLWACKASKKGCPKGFTSLKISNSNNVIVSGLRSLNSQMFHIAINGCNNVKLQNLKISAPSASPNTDGIHISQSSVVTITNSVIGTGDDCISIGPGSTNLWIQNIVCGPGHGISIGSLGQTLQEAGVQNVTVTSTTFKGTENGVRIKTFAKPSNGFVKNVLFQHVTMVNVKNPIIIDQHYCPSGNGCSNQESGVKINGITYLDIHGTSTKQVGVKFDCSKTNPCSGLRFNNINLLVGNSKVVPQVSCSNAKITTSGVTVPVSCS